MFDTYDWNFTIIDKNNNIITGEIETKAPASIIALKFEIQGYQILTLSRVRKIWSLDKRSSAYG
jgi:hypothetical protein